MKANELIRRFSRAADLAANLAGVSHAPEGETAEEKLAVLETILRDRLLVPKRQGCPHEIRFISWDAPAREWRCTCGQTMNLDGSVKI